MEEFMELLEEKEGVPAPLDGPILDESEHLGENGTSWTKRRLGESSTSRASPHLSGLSASRAAPLTGPIPIPGKTTFPATQPSQNTSGDEGFDYDSLMTGTASTQAEAADVSRETDRKSPAVTAQKPDLDSKQEHDLPPQTGHDPESKADTRTLEGTPGVTRKTGVGTEARGVDEQQKPTPDLIPLQVTRYPGEQQAQTHSLISAETQADTFPMLKTQTETKEPESAINELEGVQKPRSPHDPTQATQPTQVTQGSKVGAGRTAPAKPTLTKPISAKSPTLSQSKPAFTLLSSLLDERREIADAALEARFIEGVKAGRFKAARRAEAMPEPHKMQEFVIRTNQINAISAVLGLFKTLPLEHLSNAMFDEWAKKTAHEL